MPSTRPPLLGSARASCTRPDRPNSGVFLQITADDAADLPVPGEAYTFGIVKAAQARGDFDVLAERKRRALRLHLGKDVGAGLARLARSIDAALA